MLKNRSSMKEEDLTSHNFGSGGGKVHSCNIHKHSSIADNMLVSKCTQLELDNLALTFFLLHILC